MLLKLKAAAWQEAKLSNDLDGNFGFLVAEFFCVHSWKEMQNMFFFKWTNFAIKNQKKPSELLENCTTYDAGILNAHFMHTDFKKIEKFKNKKKN